MAWPRADDRRLLAASLALLTVLAWWALWRGEHSWWGHAVLHTHVATPTNSSPLTFAIAFVLGWTVMTIAMMLPTSSPFVLLFHTMAREKPDAYKLVGLLVGGYLAVWALFGVVAYLLYQVTGALFRATQQAWIAGALILLVAGLYQFSSLKYACLDKCRSPMLFLVEHWSSSDRKAADALRVGAAHGLYCVGCCWSLMLVMFAVSTGSFAWMLALGIVMAMEKNLPWGRRLAAPVGVVLITAAIATAIVHS